MTNLERVTSALQLQDLRLKYLADEPLGVVDGVLRVAVGQIQGFIPSQHNAGGECDGAWDAHPPFFVCYHLHIPATRVKDPDRAESGAQVEADHFWFGRRQVLLAQVASQEQHQNHGPCGEITTRLTQLNQKRLARIEFNGK